MEAPLFVRPLTAEERQQLRVGLHSREAFTLRRCQILLASAQGQRPAQIAAALGCGRQTVRNTLPAFERWGLDCLARRSSRPKSAHRLLDAPRAERLRELLHQSPRAFGYPQSHWTLPLAAAVCHQQGRERARVEPRDGAPSHPTAGPGLEAGQAVDHQPRPGLRAQKKARARLLRLAEAHPDWVLGFADETWWSRLARPQLHAWSGPGGPLRLQQLQAQKDDPEPKALCCYGLLRADTEAIWLRFVQGRPVSQVTEDFLAWVCERLAAEGRRALLLVWDNAAWHTSQRMRAHNRRVKREGGVRILACALPTKSPWLNRIEPYWVHGKRAILEADRKLTAAETIERVCAYFGCENFPPLAQQLN
jgi:transposase